MALLSSSTSPHSRRTPVKRARCATSRASLSCTRNWPFAGSSSDAIAKVEDAMVVQADCVKSFAALGCLLDQLDHGLRLREVDGMTALGLDHRRARALGHLALGRRRNHLVLGGYEIPAALALPGRFGDCAGQSVHTPRHLLIPHEDTFAAPPLS